MVAFVALAIVAGGAGLGTTGCGTLVRREYTREQLGAQLQKRFPIEKQKVVFKFRLSEPQLTFPGGDRVGLGVKVEATSLGEMTARGRALVEGSPTYRVEDGGIYLRNPVLRELHLDGAPEGRPSRVRELLSAVIVGLLTERPVYTLDPARSPREARAREHLRRLWIEGDKLIIEFAL